MTVCSVIASQRVGAKRRPRREAIQKAASEDWIASSQGLLAMTNLGVVEETLHVIASEAKQSRRRLNEQCWIALSHGLLAMTVRPQDRPRAAIRAANAANDVGARPSSQPSTLGLPLSPSRE
jgi:hypothetical protein